MAGEVGEGGSAAQDIGGDAVGVEHRDELEHGAGQAGGAEPVGVFDGEGPGGRHRDGLVIGQGAGFGEQVGQFPEPVGQQTAVAGAGDVGVDDVGGGLGQGEGQVPQVGGEAADLVGGLLAVVSGEYGCEIGGGILGGEQAHGHQASAGAGQGGLTAARGDQDTAARAGGRPPATYIGRIRDVVQYDQPPARLLSGFRLQPGQERPRGLLRVAGVGGKDLYTSLRVAGRDR